MHQQADESRQPHDRLTRGQIDKMVDDAARFEEADKVDRDRAVSRNELEGCLCGLTGQLGDEDGLEGRLVAEDHGALVEAVEEGIEWLEENPRAEACGPRRGAGEHAAQRRSVEETVAPLLSSADGASGVPDDEDLQDDEL